VIAFLEQSGGVAILYSPLPCWQGNVAGQDNYSFVKGWALQCLLQHEQFVSVCVCLCLCVFVLCLSVCVCVHVYAYR